MRRSAIRDHLDIVDVSRSCRRPIFASILPVVLLGFANLFLFLTVLFAQTDWQILESSYFKLYYVEVDEKAAWDLSTLIETEYSKLSSQLDLELLRPVKVFLSPSAKVFNELTGNLIPHWGEGVADLTHNLIILKSPDLSRNYHRFPKLVRHEITHILIGQALLPPQTIPKWFNEGLAIHFSNDEQFAGGKAISKALISDSIIPLDEIDDILRFQREKAQLAYEQSHSIILFLLDQFGSDCPMGIVQELRKGNSFTQAFLITTGQDLFDFELQWLRHIKKKYRGRFLIDFDVYIWILMLLLFISVFVIIKIRNRRILKRWDQEEGLGSL